MKKSRLLIAFAATALAAANVYAASSAPKSALMGCGTAKCENNSDCNGAGNCMCFPHPFSGPHCMTVTINDS
jgi:hypothetical protein